ncbi:MAG: FMN-binding negative transcriptional regulator [Proteobacteria bacterium]|nr:FMN-binding negative transcriptional regulator [Pseudomonadota bacterium]
MYLPKHFEETRPAQLQRFLQLNSLATLFIAGSNGLTANHIPLALRPDDGPHGSLVGHVARANPLWKQATSAIECLAVFHGRHHYISPNGYATRSETGQVVPTWNYEVVHVTGTLQAIEDAGWVRSVLTDAASAYEADQPTPWTLAEPPADFLEAMMRGIVGIRLQVSTMTGKFKLSQNQPEANRTSLLAALHARGGAEAEAMAAAIEAHRPIG